MKFVDLRRVGRGDVETHAKLRSRELMRITKEIAVDAGDYAVLKPWEKAEVRARAFGLAADRAVLCSLSAARILGVAVLSSSPVVELTYMEDKAPASRKQWPMGTVYRRGMLLENEVTRVDGIWVTGAGRTCLDIARFHGVREGVVAMDDALRNDENVTKRALRERAEEMAKLKGICDARLSIELATGKSESVLESLARIELVLWGSELIETIEEQVEFLLPDGTTVRVDLLINGWLIIELDGENKYDGETFGGDPGHVLRAERRRENSLRQLGHTVVRFSYAEVRRGVMREAVERLLRDDLAASA